MRVKVFQVRAGEDKRENLRRICSMLESSSADLNVFPEYLMGVGREGVTASYVTGLAEPLDGEFAGRMIDISREKGFAVVFSMFLRERERVFNAAVLADKGRVAAVYRKVHLFDAYGYKESRVFSPGTEPVVTRVEGYNLGLAVCFDLRFPELFRAMMLRGAEVFVVPSAWYRGPYKVEQWISLTKARAHENVSYLLAVNQASENFIGHSVVVSPWGYTLTELGEGEAVIELELDRGELEKAREALPVRNLLRVDLYRRWLENVK
ncbi:MAG: carbon-nitrogen hydrolase family protein [Thermofilaceae archaeon]|nr:carbon-nitrogen hydrolase family protein [Thermofilaceae archaeon]MCX8179882.1 carbon-nitrogen hydrolase family protein [Thermofilaceae archaeon]MDW8004433.1 carbon-nitrogen hydrolase family protein [Thermofilaceae archaeon]